MYRRLIPISLKLSFLGRGMIYTTLFALSSSFYLIIFSYIITYLLMLALSLILLITSILSDKKTLVQFITLLVLSGAKKVTVIICLGVYMFLRVLLMTLAYTLYLVVAGFTHIITPTITFYILLTILLPEITYRVMKE